MKAAISCRGWVLAGLAALPLVGAVPATAGPATSKAAAKPAAHASSSTTAQAVRIDIDALTNETQKGSPVPDDATLVWWIPEEFWRGSLTQDPSMTASQVEQFLKVVRPYTVVVVADGKVGPLGGITYKPEPAIRSCIKIRDTDGATYAPLAADAIAADAKNLLSVMKPVLENALGPAGKNMHFFVFPGKSKKGQPIASARTAGSFTILLADREFRWRLPLGSLMPTSACPKCSEKVSGAFKFCPWDGAKLP